MARKRRKQMAVVIGLSDEEPTPVPVASSSAPGPEPEDPVYIYSVTNNNRHRDIAVGTNNRGRRRITHKTATYTDTVTFTVSGALSIPGNDPVIDDGEFLSLPQEEPAPTALGKRKRKRKRWKTSTGNPLHDWLPFRNTFLDELLRLEGILDNEAIPPCQGCNIAPRVLGQFKCDHCTGGLFLCASCTVSAHTGAPFHSIKRWNGTFLERTSLQAIGLRLQLGHDGLPCPHPFPCKSPLVIVDVTGIHEVAINYCDCGRHGSGQHIVQLLRASWWPATVDRPSTAITFTVLKLFHALTLQGKMNAYDFYCGLVRITDGIGTHRPKYRYKEFIRSIRCFRQIRAAKRAARGHDPKGIDATAPGELVVTCPLCPNPDRNMPEGWEDTPKSEAWKHALFLAVDANFKLKLKNRGLSDVELAPGWSYFVNSEEYEKHLADYADEPEMKHCDSNHSAIDHANTPAQKRFAVNGVGAVICSRHCFYRKHCIGDLQRGEKYSNMDYMLLSTVAMMAPKIKNLVISYDIACSFHKNFAPRMAKHPAERQIDLRQVMIKWAVPKFHLLAHGASCQSKFSLNLMEGVGRTHGEGIETGWADLNGAALSTREMVGAARHEVLDDVLGAINWRKLINIGNSVKSALKTAVKLREVQKVVFDELDTTLPEDVRSSWEAMVLTYDEDKTAPNPYKEPVSATTLADVRIQLADEEALEASQGHLSLHETTASVFLSVGMELEEQQRVLQARVKKSDGTSADKASLKEKQNVLRHRITSWRQIQHIYMPGVAHLIAPAPALDDSEEAATLDPPYNTPLYLPSQIPAPLRESGCAPGLLKKEERLRYAQGEDSLHQGRRSLRTRMGLIHYKHVQVDGPGNKANTRARDLIQRHTERLERHVDQYRAARDALLVLSPNGDWQNQLRELKDEDIRSPRLDEGELGQGKHEVSWIWRVLKPDVRDMPRGDDETTQEEIHNSFRVDWAQSRARHRCWDEEVSLLQEEIKRVIRDLEFRAVFWDGKADARTGTSSDIKSGLHAYASRQASQFREIAFSFVNQWRPLLKAYKLPELWPPTDYVLPDAPTPANAGPLLADGAMSLLADDITTTPELSDSDADESSDSGNSVTELVDIPLT